MSSEIEKAQLGAQTFALFCQQFGEDVYGKLLLEILLEGLLNEETVFVFGEQEQTGDQIDHSSSGTGSSNGQSDKSIIPNVAPELGSTNHTDCP